MNNSAPSFISKLQEKIEQDSRLINEAENRSRLSIETAQIRLEKHLSQLLSDAKSTTEGVTTGLETELAKLPLKLATSISQSTEQVSQAMKTQIDQDTKRLIWMLRVPFWLLLFALLSVVLAGWLMTPRGLWNETTTTQTTDDKQYIVITTPGWTTCTIDGNKYPCKITE